jgi:hypothetical protein
MIEIAGRRFLRGVDITKSYRPSWQSPVRIEYDETWCAELDQRVEWKERLAVPSYVEGAGYEIDSLSTEETLFETRYEPRTFILGRAVF